VADHLCIGWEPVDARDVVAAAGGGVVGRTTLEAVAAFAGLSVVGSEIERVPIIAKTEIHSSRLGRTSRSRHLGGRPRDDSRGDGPGVRDGRVHASPRANARKGMVVEGEPTMLVKSDDWSGWMSTCATVVNLVPDFLAARPGLVTVDRLPLRRYRTGPLLHRAVAG
jgi:4-hydroxy-tetrahydrodipicolinate reductase